jgi:positive regulator of sigma E activity
METIKDIGLVALIGLLIFAAPMIALVTAVILGTAFSWWILKSYRKLEEEDRQDQLERLRKIKTSVRKSMDDFQEDQ